MNPHIDSVINDAHDLAKCLRDDKTLTALQRLAAGRIVEGFEAAKVALIYTPRAPDYRKALNTLWSEVTK